MQDDENIRNASGKQIRVVGRKTLLLRFQGSKGNKCVSFLVSPDISQSGIIIAWELLKKRGILNSSYPYPKDSQDHQVNIISSSSKDQTVCTITGDMVKQVEDRVAREQASGRPKKPPSTSEPDPEYEAKMSKLMHDLCE